MNTLNRKMFANGDVVNIDPFILPRNPNYVGDDGNLLPDLIAQGSGLNQKDPSDYRMGGGLASQLTDQNFPPFQKMPEEGLIPDADVDALFEKINDVLLPNEIELSNGERIDFTEEIKAIQSGEAGEGYNIYPILRSPNIKLGTNVKAVLKDFGERDTPGFLKMLGQEDTDFGDMARLGIATIGEIGKENLKQIVPFFTGQRAFDKYTKDVPFVQSEFMGGDPKGFVETGGRSAEEVDALIKNFNTNNFGDTIADALSGFELRTDKLNDLMGIQTQLDAVNSTPNATDANATVKGSFDSKNESITEGGGQKGRDAANQEVSVTEVSVDDKEQPKNITDEELVKDVTAEEVAEDITSEDAPKRNFAQFTRSPDFLRFVRNIGKGLTTTGQLGQGIALGAAGAAEEKYAEEVALRAAQAAAASKTGDLTEKMFMEQFKSKEEFLNKQNEYSTALSKTVFEVETSDAVLGALAEAERLVRTGDVTGLSPLFQEYFNKALRQFGQDVPLSAREAAKNILEDIKNGEIKAILGESGRTISNLDRQIAGNLIGAIDFKADKETVLDKIKLARRRANDRFTNAQSNYDAALQPYTRFGVQAPFKIGTPMVQSTDESGERIRLYIK